MEKSLLAKYSPYATEHFFQRGVLLNRRLSPILDRGSAEPAPMTLDQPRAYYPDEENK